MISRQQAELFVNSRETMLSAMLRKGWVMPKLGQPLCTMKFMEAVREGSVWCPKREDIDRPVVVVTPPPQDVLSQEIVLILEEGMRQKATDSLFNPKPVQNLVDLLRKKKADTQWLLEVLYVLNRNHGVFAPDSLYIKPRRTPIN